MSLFESRLTRFKERLLDLTGRNRMIHSNFQARTKQHFRFIDEVPNQLYEKLVTSKMHFTPLPEPEETPKETKSEQSQDNIFQFSDAAKASFYITLISTVANLSVAIFSQFANYFSFGVSFSATALMVTPCIPVFSGFIDNGRVWQEEKLNEIKPYVDQLLSLKA